MASGDHNNNANRFQSLSPPSSSTNTMDKVSDNTNSPYFLHSGDHPGLILVSHPLTGPNYHTRCRPMLMALNAKSKLGFVDGSLSQPSSDASLAGVWSQCNSMVTSWLLHVVSKEIANKSLPYLDSAKAVWDLHDRFHQSNAPRVFQLKQRLHGLCQGSLDVNTYYTRLKIFWDELRHVQPVPVCHCGGMKAWMGYQQHEYVFWLFRTRDNDSIGSGYSIPQSLLFSALLQLLLPLPCPLSHPNLRKLGPFVHIVGLLLVRYTIDKCYRIYGHPPGNKPKSKAQHTMVNSL